MYAVLKSNDPSPTCLTLIGEVNLAAYNQAMRKFSFVRSITIWITLALLLTGCLSPVLPATLTLTNTPFPPTPTSTSTPTAIPPTLTPTLIPTLTSTPEPTGCLKPPEDYTRIDVDGSTINQRTLAMLIHAQELYGGELQIAADAITQGSYSDSVAASFGTHSGGGAIDLSVMRKGTYTVLCDDVEPLI